MFRTLVHWSRRNSAVRRVSVWLARPDTRRSAVRALVRWDRGRTIGRALAGDTANLDDIERFVLARPVAIRAPVALISQAHRSGGTLLSQLLDGHPAVAAHPHELKIGGISGGEDWPLPDPSASAEKTFRMLFEPYHIGLMRRGYTKGTRDTERRPFFIVPRIQFRLFLSLCEATRPTSGREVLDRFFTAYFNAWLNYRGDLREKRWISAFAPRLAHHEASVERFFETYPDGRLIQIVRDPRTWYPSAKHHDPEPLADRVPEEIIGPWRASATSILRNKARFGDRVLVLRFEDLVGRTEATMRRLALELEIEFHPVLLEPTFNGKPIRANSSFDVKQNGIIAEPLYRSAMLSGEEEEYIESQCIPIYRSVLDDALTINDKYTKKTRGNIVW